MTDKEFKLKLKTLKTDILNLFKHNLKKIMIIIIVLTTIVLIQQ